MSKVSKVLINRFNDAKTAINSKYQIDSYLADKGIKVESNRQICCPFHDDSTPSFSVNTSRNVWKCFGCPDGGHFIDLWLKYENKYNSKDYTPFTAVEAIIQTDKDLQKELGFSTVFQQEEDTFDYFSKIKETANETRHFNYDIPLARRQKITKVNTASMQDVMRSLKNANIQDIIQFIADCELSMQETELISKYSCHYDVIGSYIDQITDNMNELNSVAEELKGALADE